MVTPATASTRGRRPAIRAVRRSPPARSSAGSSSEAWAVARAEAGQVQGGPEPVARPGEVPAGRGRVQALVDAAEQHAQRRAWGRQHVGDGAVPGRGQVRGARTRRPGRRPRRLHDPSLPRRRGLPHLVRGTSPPTAHAGRSSGGRPFCYVITLAVQVPFLDQLFYAGRVRLRRVQRRRGELVTVAFDNLTLSQRVYEHLRHEILADHLLPGTELSEVALSKELAISRGPSREAMGRLAAEGLITMRPRRRAEVRSLTPQELIDAYQVREALEVMAVRLAIPRVTEADLSRVEELIDLMAEHSAEGAVREFFAANVSFHELLCELSGNPKLQEVHHRLGGEIGRFQNRTLALRGSTDDSLA